MSEEIKLVSYVENFPKIDADQLLELFRELRQTTVSKSEQEANFKEVVPCLELLVKIVQYLEDGHVDNVIDKFVLSVCSRVGVQFVGNSIVDNEENQKLLWSHSDKLKKIFQRDDTKIKNYTSMVYYNLMLSCEQARMDMLDDDEFKFMLLDEALLGLSEFPQFTVEKFLKLNHFDRLFTDKSRLLHRLYILDMICSLIRNDLEFSFDLEQVRRISEDFKRESEIILNGLKSKMENSDDSDGQIKNDDDPRLTVKLLSTLCCLSGDDKYQKIISDDSSLLIYVIYVLRALKMIEDGHQEKTDNSSNPVIIDFKGNLIRLLGNMCWKNEKNQNLVRENKCIELILECCKLDENNPFICEWSILAIKNLCDGNKENQEFIASLQPIDLALSRRIAMDLSLVENPSNQTTNS